MTAPPTNPAPAGPPPAIRPDHRLAALPALVFTVAITGHRHLALDVDQLGATIERLLADTARRLHQRAHAYPAIDAHRRLDLRFVTALAEGADQIGAQAALGAEAAAAGWQCQALLPFARDVYRATIGNEGGRTAAQIAEARARYDSLLARIASVMELADWAPTAPPLPAESDPAHPLPDDRQVEHFWQTRRFEALGELLVRRADLLIAVWDGLPGRGRGGSAGVIAEARRAGVPIVWIDTRTADGTPRSIVTDEAHRHMPNVTLAHLLRHPVTADDHAAAAAAAGSRGAIDAAITNVLLGEDPRRRAGVLRWQGERVRRWWRRTGGSGRIDARRNVSRSSGTGAAVYSLLLTAVLVGTKLRSWPMKWAHARRSRLPHPLMQEIAYDFAVKGRNDPEAKGSIAPARIAEATDCDGALKSPTVRADAIATRLGHAYRSAYVSIFTLAAFAVGMALTYVFFPHEYKWIFVSVELAALVGAAVIYRNADQGDVHQRWLDARVIAESLRGEQMLSWIGMSGRRRVEVELGEAARHEPAGDLSAEQQARQNRRQRRRHLRHRRCLRLRAWGRLQIGYLGQFLGCAPRPLAPPRLRPRGSNHLWAPWFGNAVAALPAPPEGALDPARIAALAQAVENVLADQSTYHRRNHERLERFHHRLDVAGVALVVVGAAAAVLFLLATLVEFAEAPALVGILPEAVKGAAHHLGWLGEHHLAFANVAAFLGGAFPALAGALASIRYHGDFERFATRSQTTYRQLGKLVERARALRDRASTSGAMVRGTEAPLFEELLGVVLDAKETFDEDLAVWRFAFAARPMPLPG